MAQAGIAVGEQLREAISVGETPDTGRSTVQAEHVHERETNFAAYWTVRTVGVDINPWVFGIGVGKKF